MAKQTLSDLVQEAARTLPEGWNITLEVERDAGTVTLTDPDGMEQLYPTNPETIEEDFADAIEYAKLKDVPAEYCHECSKAGGADAPIYHQPPLCSPDPDPRVFDDAS